MFKSETAKITHYRYTMNDASDGEDRPQTAIGLFDDDNVARQPPRAQTAMLPSTTSTTTGDSGSKLVAARPITTGGISDDRNNSNQGDSEATKSDNDDALRDRLIEDLDYKRRRLKVQGDIAADDVAATGELLKDIHGDQSVLVNAARDAGLFGEERQFSGRMAEETFAHELRELAEDMGVPDWLKEADLAMKLREKSIASKIVTRELMDKVGDRATEANDTLEAVEEVSEKLQRNAEIIRTRVRDHFDKLRNAMRKREQLLISAVEQVAAKKEKTLQSQRVEISDALAVISKANKEATEAMGGDDIEYLQSFLSHLNDRLDVAAETFVNSTPYCTPNIPCQFGHSTLEGIIAGHGTVGDVEELAVGGPTGFGLLQWDPSRTDPRLKILDNGHGIEHVGQTGKATSMSTTGFANGRNLWRIVPDGTKEGEWVSLGVCTAGLIGSSAYAQDSVIFSFAPSSGGSGSGSGGASSKQRPEEEAVTKTVGALSIKKRKNAKYEITQGDVIAISLDCATGSVEYYKNSVCIKTAMLFASSSAGVVESAASLGGSRASTAATRNEEDGTMTPRGSSRVDAAPEVVWYPFATLYENGQSVRFDKVG